MTEKLLLDDRYLSRLIPRRSRPAADPRVPLSDAS
jgi:hypothetical protein